MQLFGTQAIKYTHELGNSIMPQTDLPEYAGRFTTLEEASRVAAISPRDVYYVADRSHPEHAAIMAKITS